MLRDVHVGWRAIRLASIRGKELLKTEYPFSSDRFKNIGKSLFAEVVDAAGDRRLIDLVRDQWVFEKLVLESMRKGVHYEHDDQPQWWAPLGDDRAVMIHPSRAFGAPVVVPGSIRTRVLYGSYRAEESHEAVAQWYGVSVGAVKDAVEFEASIRKAA
jgi:uncharacterized protein (DUF433 family)